MAAAIGTIPWEIVCRLGSRIERRYDIDHGQAAQDRFRLPGMRGAVPEVARTLRRLRRVELARRGAAGRARTPGGRRASLRDGRRRRASRDSTPRSRSSSTRGSRPGSTSSIACWAAASCPGSLVLLGGEPGIGKSTLLLQAAANMARTVGPVLYSSGEESEHQIKSRGERLGVGTRAALSAGRNLPRADPRRDRAHQAGARHRRLDPDGVLAEVPVGARQHRPGARSGDAAALHREGPERARRSSSATSRRTAASPGPKALEHVVDTVLYFEGERHHSHRVVRAVKNRFGAVSELGVFEMTSTGLRPVPNPSKMFLAERPVERAGFGGAVLGRRARGRSSSKCRRSSAPAPTATRGAWRAASISSGCRCCSRCSKSAPGLNLIGDDVFVNIAGGMTVDEPASDLGVLAAIASSVRNRVIPADHGDVRRSRAGRRGPRHLAGAAARPRSGADGVPPLHHAGGEHRSGRTAVAGRRRASWSASARSAKPSTRC